MPAVDRGDWLEWPVQAIDSQADPEYAVTTFVVLGVTQGGTVAEIACHDALAHTTGDRDLDRQLFRLVEEEQRRCLCGLPSILGSARRERCERAAIEAWGRTPKEALVDHPEPAAPEVVARRGHLRLVVGGRGAA